MPQISPHAIVECPANLADDVVVGPFAYIGPDVRIGAGTRVDNNVTLEGNVQLGCENRIHPFALIGHPSQPGRTGGRVIIGDRNNIREHVTISAGANVTRIGDDNLIMIGCYVGPDVVVEDQVILGNYTQLADRTHVEKCVWASGFTGTRTGTTIGAYTFTSGYAGIDRDAPPFAMVQGFPFRIRTVNTHNLKKRGFDDESIGVLKEAFRSLFNGENGEPDIERVKELSQQTDLQEHVRYLVDFLCRSSHRHDDDMDTSAGQSFAKGS